MTRQSKAPARAKRPVKTEPRLSRTRQPEDSSAEVWQTALRRQFGREQAFGLEALGTEPVFSEFIVSNPECGGNMGMPWNPAVLEQRIGRVHRLGQHKSVQVVNFVAQGSIEEGMLSVLAFKKSLFAGVLDGGESEVFLQGTRLSKFMESVDKVTGAMGEVEVASAPPSEAAGDVPEAAPAPATGPAPAAAVQAAPTPDPWAPRIDVRLQLVNALVHRRADPAGAPAAWIDRDPHTGRDILKLPLPEPQTVQRLADALSGLLTELRRS